MHAYFWGTRGSLPSSLTTTAVRAKIHAALKAARGRELDTDEAIDAFLDSDLPLATRGTYGNNTSCVEIGGGDETVICDAGSGLRDFGGHVLATSSADPDHAPHTFHLFISHPHWDHIHGFPFFVPAYIPGNRIRIYGCHQELEAAFVTQQDSLHFPVPFSALGADVDFTILEPETTYDVAGFRVQPIKQNHPGDSYGYRFERDGKALVYSTDAEHKEDLEDEDYPFLDFFRDADLLIFDAQYTLIDAIHSKLNWGHSSNMVGVELCVRAGVKRLCLFHNEHTCSDEALDRFLQDTRKYLSLYAEDSKLHIDLAHDGLELRL